MPWHGKDYYYGLHYDLHANADDTELGANAEPDILIPQFEMMGCDFVQTDCKGHGGYTSWYSKVKDASVSPGVQKDHMAGWREATRKLGLPLHCHYSGVYDRAAGEKHPEWRVVLPEGIEKFEGGFGNPEAAMCPRSGYVDELMIPQMFELIDRYEVDGFWVDGDMWAATPCYCEKCTSAFEARTGITEIPTAPGQPHWAEWMVFTRDSFEEYVTHYCDAVHEHKAGVLVCSNWLQTFKYPGEPRVPTDWISGDNRWVFGMDSSRMEARFISTRGKPWDIMIWSFYRTGAMRDPTAPWVFKSVDMMVQEAAVTLALGGNVQFYEHPHGLRNGQLVDWRQKRLGEVGQFVKARKELCQDTETLPQVAVLHSEDHLYSDNDMRPNLHHGVDFEPVQGAAFALLEAHYGVDVMDEWALLPRLDDFPVVVVPERHRLSEEMVEALKDWVKGGGRLMLSGAATLERFGEAFTGAKIAGRVEDTAYHVSAEDGAAPVWSADWAMLQPQGGRPIGTLGTTTLLNDRLTPNPAAVIHTVGAGKVASIPFDVFRYFDRVRYPMVQQFVAEVADSLIGDLPIWVGAPLCVDVILRKKGTRTLIHLINRASGIPNQPNNGAVDEIPKVGPVNVEMKMDAKPQDVYTAFEGANLSWDYEDGILTARIKRFRIHEAIVIEEGEGAI
jgi:hypothetical protein